MAGWGCLCPHAGTGGCKQIIEGLGPYACDVEAAPIQEVVRKVVHDLCVCAWCVVCVCVCVW